MKLALSIAFVGAMFNGCSVLPPSPPTPHHPPMPGVRYHVVDGQTSVTVDPHHSIVIPYQLYPLEAQRLHQEGSCLVKLTVDIDGKVIGEEITVSTGVSSLDAACLTAFKDARLLPAIRDGKPVIHYIEMPVAWWLP